MKTVNPKERTEPSNCSKRRQCEAVLSRKQVDVVAYALSEIAAGIERSLDLETDSENEK